MLLSIKSIEHCKHLISYDVEEKMLVDNPRWKKMVSHGYDELILCNNVLHKINHKTKIDKKPTLSNDSALVNKVIVTLNELSTFLCKCISDNEAPEQFLTEWKSFLINKCKCQLLRSIEYVQKDGNNPSLGDYRITCDSEYEENKHQRKFADNVVKLYNKQVYACNFIEVEYSTNSVVATELAQVIAILSFPDMNSKHHQSIYMVIAWLKESDKHKMFPYPAYTYNYDNKHQIKNRYKPFMQIISVESIYRPSFVIPLQERGNFWGTKTLMTKAILQNIPFYKIPFERSFRRYCDGFVEYIDHHLADPAHGPNENKIPTNVILNDYELGLVDNMIQGMDDEFDIDEEDHSLNSMIDDDASYDSGGDEISINS
jgi:hypothetical protein